MRSLVLVVVYTDTTLQLCSMVFMPIAVLAP